jgi:hypothetical protein
MIGRRGGEQFSIFHALGIADRATVHVSGYAIHDTCYMIRDKGPEFLAHPVTSHSRSSIDRTASALGTRHSALDAWVFGCAIFPTVMGQVQVFVT